MTDTPPHIRQIQVDIILSKTPTERAMMGLDMIDSVYEIVKNSILELHPGISRGELIGKIFRRYYSDTFTEAQLTAIENQIIAFHQ